MSEAWLLSWRAIYLEATHLRWSLQYFPMFSKWDLTIDKYASSMQTSREQKSHWMWNTFGIEFEFLFALRHFMKKKKTKWWLDIAFHVALTGQKRPIECPMARTFIHNKSFHFTVTIKTMGVFCISYARTQHKKCPFHSYVRCFAAAAIHGTKQKVTRTFTILTQSSQSI